MLALLWRIEGNLEEVYLLSSSHELWTSAADMHRRYRRLNRALCPSAAEPRGIALKLTPEEQQRSFFDIVAKVLLARKLVGSSVVCACELSVHVKFL